jgi:hypothetical protein
VIVVWGKFADAENSWPEKRVQRQRSIVLPMGSEETQEPHCARV